ncbi:MAG: class I SAM-dependent methyltransferase [Candidatus Levyibacteriota bacterium]
MLKYGKNKKFNPSLLSSHNIDRKTAALIPEGSKVLDIGCATGFLGDYLMKQKACVVDGLEMGTEEAKIAKNNLRYVYIGNAENKGDLNKIKQKYDVVNASALIEHLKDPLAALKEWKKLLRKDGSLILSTSNIAHFSMRLSLLRGKFDYKDYGILDNTHLRLFTIDSFKQIVQEAGYTIDIFDIDAEGGGFPRVSILGSKLFPGLFAYQMLIKAHV